MKKSGLFVVGAAIVLAAGCLYWHGRREAQVSAAAPGGAPAAVLSVNDLRGSPGRLRGEIEVQGVVSGTKAGRQLFGLIDKREADSCGRLDCADFTLPVKWSGALPAPGETVRVKGHVSTTDEGLVFIADGVDRQ